MSDTKTPQEIALLASQLMEALSDYINETDKKIVATLKRGEGHTLSSAEIRTRNLFCELYGSMIKWKFDVEKMAHE